MKLWDILKTVGTGVITSVTGGAAPLVLGAINAVLPDDAKLPEGATGQQAQDALASIPAEARAKLMDKEFDVQITQIKESNSTVRMMLESDAASPHTTRPKIAMQSFQVIAFSIITTTALWAYAVLAGDVEMVTAIMDGWVFIVGVNGTLATLLLAYFGVLKQEHKQKLNAAGGHPSGGVLSSLISSITRK
jgi:hypothetical protein